MRILHELNQLDRGGAERVVLGIAKHDKKNRHIVFTFKDGPMRKVFEKAGIQIEMHEEEKTTDLQVDIVHVHTGGAPSRLARDVKGDLPVVETIHSPVVSRVRDEWVTQRVGVTNQVTKKNRKCLTIYNGIDVNRLQTETDKVEFKKAFNIPPDSFVIGRLGRLGYDKCVEDFLSACWWFQKDHPDKDKIYVIICGDEAEKGYWGKIKVMCGSLPLVKQSVRFIEGAENVMPVYNAMDVFMYPSPTEGFGLVYMEAMACGVPVVAWDTPVTREILMGHAKLVPQSVDGLVSGLKFFYDNKVLREEFGDFGQDLVLSEFTEEMMSKDYQKLYDQIYLKEYGEEKVGELVKP
jgi:glycosyltransferase involved in cell wall biosynthesis